MAQNYLSNLLYKIRAENNFLPLGIIFKKNFECDGTPKMGQKWVFSGQSTPLEVKKKIFFVTHLEILGRYNYIPSFKFFRLKVRFPRKKVQIPL